MGGRGLRLFWAGKKIDRALVPRQSSGRAKKTTPVGGRKLLFVAGHGSYSAKLHFNFTASNITQSTLNI